MSDPGTAIQKGVRDALVADATLATLIGSPPRVYDDVPKNPTYPYVTIWDDEQVNIATACHDLTETFLHVRAWSRAKGVVELKQIAAAVRGVLDTDIDSPISLTGFSIRSHRFRSRRIVKDRDGLTKQAIVTFEFITEPV